MAKFEHILDVTESLCLRTGDTAMRNKGLYLDVASDVWNDLNEDTLRIAQRVKLPVRQRFQVNKKLNSVTLPCNAERVASVDVEINGVMYPVYRNDKLNDDIVELGQSTNCNCERSCSYQVCNIIKGYEVVKHTETDYMPDGSPASFDCVDKKVVNGGFLYSQKQYPLRQYLSGVWVDTILYTENTKLCELEVDDNGCVCDTDTNIDRICDACGIGSSDSSLCHVGGTANTPPSKDVKQWTYYCMSKMEWFSVQCGGFRFFKNGYGNIYNISQDGKRLIFPHNFGWSTVVVRMFEDIELENLMIPVIAKPTFQMGQQYYAAMFNEKKQQQAAVFGMKYSRMKWGLFQLLNRDRWAEMRMMLNPPVYVPTYFNNDAR